MSVALQILIGAQTGSANSNPFQQSVADGLCTIVAGGLASSETATVQIQDASGNWQNVPAAIAPQLTPTVPATVLTAPGVYRVVKSATVGSVGVALYRV